jgi:lipoprotein-releasing system permease protein
LLSLFLLFSLRCSLLAGEKSKVGLLMHKFFLCLRYLRKRRIAFFGIAAVALCVALLIVITSLFDGFIKSLHSYWSQSYGDILLAPNRPMNSYGQLVEALEKIDGVSSARAVTSTGALLYLGRGDVRGVELRGIDLDRAARDKAFSNSLLLQRDSTPPNFSLSDETQDTCRRWFEQKFRRPPDDTDLPVGCIVGIGILARPDELTDKYDHQAVIEQVGQRETPLFIVSGSGGSQAESETASIKKIRKTCWPVDVIQTGMHQADTHHVYVPFDYLRDLIGTIGPDGKKQCLGRIRIYLRPGYTSDGVIKDIRPVWEKFARERLNWSEDQVNFAYIFPTMQIPQLRLVTEAIHQQLAIMQIILGLICLVVALLIFVILFMIVMRKRKDIGIIRAVGSSRRAVALLFLSYGALIGLAGSAFGVVLGIWATHNINLLETILAKLLGFKIWKSGVYLFSEIPNEVDASAVMWIVFTGVLTALLGALLPAIRAARLQPVEALRYE